MDKINLESLQKVLKDNNGTEGYVIAMAALAIAAELREMNDRARLGKDPEFSGTYPTADEVLGRWRS